MPTASRCIAPEIVLDTYTLWVHVINQCASRPPTFCHQHSRNYHLNVMWLSYHLSLRLQWGAIAPRPSLPLRSNWLSVCTSAVLISAPPLLF
jgi:hypothetical protein